MQVQRGEWQVLKESGTLVVNRLKLGLSIKGAKMTSSSRLANLFKIGLSLSKKNLFIYFTESPFKMMKNAFYFTLKALFVLKYLNFCLDILVV